MTDINTVNLLNQIREMSSLVEGAKTEVATSTHETSFNNFLQQALGNVNELTQTADGLKAKFEMGDPSVSLSDVMVASQKERLGSSAVMVVRNKLVQAYQEVMNMPV